jgi:tRNA uridine 5-carboxymethylaminomethyl modification enzyme
VKAFDLLKRPQVKLDQIVLACAMENIRDRETSHTIESDIKYSGFVANQEEEIQRIRQLEQAPIPSSFNFEKVVGLLTESRIKLAKARPGSLGQASRIPGVTPADISILALHISKKQSGKTDVSHETINIEEQEET